MASIGEKLLQRREKCVCRMCGGPLEIRMIVYNQYGGEGLDLYCPKCRKIEYGVLPEVYEVAKAFVDTFEYNYYVEMEENERNRQLNIAKLCEIINWVLQYRGELDSDGLQRAIEKV